MYLSSPTATIYNNASLAMHVATFGRKAYLGISHYIGIVGANMFLFAVYLLLKPIFIVLAWHGNRLCKNYDIDIDIDIDNYKQLRLMHDAIAKRMDVINKLLKADFSKENILVRSIFRDLKRILKLAVIIHSRINNKLNKLNPNYNSKLFSNVTEKQLWNDRTTAYDYVL